MSRRTTRRQSVLPPPMSRGAKKGLADDEFISGELFDFKMASPKGVMTRARRSSIYAGTTSSLAKKTAIIANKNAKLKPVKEEKKVEKKPVSKAAPPKKPVRKTLKAKKDVAFDIPMKTPSPKAPGPSKKPRKTPAKAAKVSPKRSSPLYDEAMFDDVQLVLTRLEDTPAKALLDANEVFDRLDEVRRSPMRVQLVCRDLIKEAEEIQQEEEQKQEEVKEKKATKTPAKTPKKKEEPADMASSRLTRSTLKKAHKTPPRSTKRFSPAQHFSPKPKKALRPAATYAGTPQGANPVALLRHNLKNKVKEKMEDRVAAMPQSSPYALMEAETENGSPRNVFTKLSEKPRSAGAAAKYLTATPGLAAPRAARKVLGSIDNKLKRRSTRSSFGMAKNLNFDDTEEEDTENETSSQSINASPLKSPVKQQSQLVTGELANACSIM